MPILVLLLEVYLAAMLGVSGLAKLDAPQHFETSLHRHQILPAWAILPVSRLIPWLEVAAAGALLTGIAPVAAGGLSLLLFTCFLIVEAVLVVTRRATECACYGVAYRRKVDGASLAASAILVGLAALHLWGAAAAGPLPPGWRLAAVTFAGGSGLWLALKVAARRVRRVTVA